MEQNLARIKFIEDYKRTDELLCKIKDSLEKEKVLLEEGGEDGWILGGEKLEVYICRRDEEYFLTATLPAAKPMKTKLKIDTKEPCFKIYFSLLERMYEIIEERYYFENPMKKAGRDAKRILECLAKSEDGG